MSRGLVGAMMIGFVCPGIRGDDQHVSGIPIRLSETVRVELDIFSGEPNPAWTLTAGQREELISKLSELEPAAAPPERPGRLGYRGFRLTSAPGGNTPTLIVKVHEGVVRQEQEGRVTHGRDVERQIERWLALLAKPHVKPIVYDWVTAQLE